MERGRTGQNGAERSRKGQNGAKRSRKGQKGAEWGRKEQKGAERAEWGKKGRKGAERGRNGKKEESIWGTFDANEGHKVEVHGVADVRSLVAWEGQRVSGCGRMGFPECGKRQKVGIGRMENGRKRVAASS